jgi:hypothetical protein
MKFKNNLHNSDNVWKRRLAGYYNKFLSILYYNPLRYIGSILGAIFSKMPIMFSSSLMQSLKLITNMPISLNIKIDVDGHDYEVLLGGKQSVLNYPALKTILIEKNDKEEQIVSLLKKHGFNKVKLIDHSNKYGNIGFVREDLI